MVEDFDSEDTLCYVFDGDDVLLIEKKRGLGTELYNSFYNGPGGSVESYETPEEGAVRELKEETGLKAENIEKSGELKFYFPDDSSRFIHVYRTEDYSGSIEETDEAIPFWTDTDDIPYENMWDDDRYWMPLMLEEITFRGSFEFEDSGGEMEIAEWVLEEASY